MRRCVSDRRGCVAREAAMLLLGAECTVGFYVVYRAYKKILSDCSRRD